jgi:phosphatidylglycerophosphate synthase
VSDRSELFALRPSTVMEVPGRLLLLTLGRLAFVPAIIVALSISPLLTFALLAAFVGLDLYDGVLARELDADDPIRRALDSIVDRLSIWPVYIAASLMGMLPLVFVALMVARDLYCAALCGRMVRQKGIAIRADWLYRSLNLMLAAWIVAAPLLSSTARLGSFAFVLAFSLLVAADLRRSVLRVMRMPTIGTPAVISASGLRPGKSQGALLPIGRPVAVSAPVHF